MCAGYRPSTPSVRDPRPRQFAPTGSGPGRAPPFEQEVAALCPRRNSPRRFLRCFPSRQDGLSPVPLDIKKIALAPDPRIAHVEGIPPAYRGSDVPFANGGYAVVNVQARIAEREHGLRETIGGVVGSWWHNVRLLATATSNQAHR
jgi:hypothetical protein